MLHLLQPGLGFVVRSGFARFVIYLLLPWLWGAGWCQAN